MKVKFSCGMRDEEVELPDTYAEDDVQDEFDVWLGNRSDIGWSVISGKLAESHVCVYQPHSGDEERRCSICQKLM